ncbi:hypothetical protein M0R72_05900 [Candidatus Pacearchaeota archaeon]|jgi:hypothetical protein|nr:hypothetical protein [Candidatus Pacearchaeota archaeon]
MAEQEIIRVLIGKMRECMDLLAQLDTVPDTVGPDETRRSYKTRKPNVKMQASMEVMLNVITLRPGITRAQLIKEQDEFGEGPNTPLTAAQITARLLALEKETRVVIIRETYKTWRLYSPIYDHIPPDSCVTMVREIVQTNASIHIDALVNSVTTRLGYYTRPDVLDAIRNLSRAGMLCVDYPEKGIVYITEKGKHAHAQVSDL